jgi:hypothetical protein
LHEGIGALGKASAPGLVGRLVGHA